MAITESTALARELGNELRRRRLAVGLSCAELGSRMMWSAAKVSRIETGNRISEDIDVVFYLAHCGAKRDDVDELLPMCQNAGRGFWLSQQLRSLIFHESTARATRSYDSLLVPGLLQAQQYARVLIGQAQISAADVDYAVEIRMRRQRILYDEWRPLQSTFFIHEQALRVPVGGDRVMNEQLLKLVLLAERPNITIRVVPTSLGERSYFGPPFSVFEYRHHQPLIYQENAVDGLFIEDAEYVRRYRYRLERIAKAALDTEQSRILLASVAGEYDRLGGDQIDASDDLAEEQLHR